MIELTDIITGCVKNKRSAQDQLYKQYSPMLFGICLRYAKSRPEAEDILQEGFVKIYTHIKTYTPGKSFEGWMRRIVVNTAITVYRKEKKRSYHQDISEIEYSKPDSRSEHQADYTKEELMIAIDKLPPGYKMVFNMYAIEGYKHKEIAEELDIDINTSKSQLSRAKKHLQKYLLEMSRVSISNIELI